MGKPRFAFVVALVIAAVVPRTASSAVISWATWSSNVKGSIHAPGTDVSIAYSGELGGLSLDYPSWSPASTFTDGVKVENAPPPSGNMVQLLGGSDTVVDTITFSPPIVDPVFATWSLGRTAIPATFVFDAQPTLISGGPNAEFGGVSVTVSGNTLTGAEANGTVLFPGTYSSISWTNPIEENYYGFTIGITAVPEPIGIGWLVFAIGVFQMRRHRKRLP